MYNLHQPDKKYFLPYVLEEISGLSYYKNDIVACIQDESGKIYFYNLANEEMVHTSTFEYGGDYEGIEIVNDKVFIVKSDGDLFVTPLDFRTEKRQAERIKTKFKSKNDIEGLGFDPKLNALLLVTKDDAGIDDEKDRDSKGVYAFYLDKMKLDKDALFIITRKEREEFFKSNNPENRYDDKRLLFKPSGIAVHPIDGDYYVLASVGKLLMVLSPDGSIKASHPIKPGILGQPEGICFAPDGTMYIASEGDGDRGYILKYSMKE